MTRWRFLQRSSGGTALPPDAWIARRMRQELEAIADRRGWEPTETRAPAPAVAGRRSAETTPSDRAA